MLSATCLTFDLSGHGSDASNYNRYSVHEHLEDVAAAFDYLASIEAVNPSRMGVCGASYGAYLSALLTRRRTGIRRLILRAPSLVGDIEPTLPPQDLIQLDSLAALERYSGHTLIIESECDEVIPKPHIEAYLRVCKYGQRLVIPKAAHALSDPEADEMFVKAIVEWFARL
jgi:pimeloyl-ACP methyl ester carboxylesterase